MSQPDRPQLSRRQRLSVSLHRLALLLTLVLAAAALVYNALSIVNGDAGLIGLTKVFDAATTESPLSPRHG
jgi:hypothetical protein